MLAMTVLSNLIVMLDELVLGTALETPFPAAVRCMVASTALAEVTAAPRRSCARQATGASGGGTREPRVTTLPPERPAGGVG